MKIGVFLENSRPETGGGYTFQNEIFSSLVKLSHETHHTFVIFGLNKVPLGELDGKNFQYISLYHNFGERVISKVCKFAKRVIINLHISNYLNIYTKSEKIINRSHIDILLCLTPSCPNMDVPYIIMVWDLQHRLQPYFPEVSIRGAWVVREQLYGELLRRALVVITGTEAGKTEIERFYHVPSERIKKLPHPTPSNLLGFQQIDDKKVLSKYNIQEEYLFYPAQLWPHKNHVGLLRCIKLLRDKYNLIFSIVFVGSDKGNLKYLKELVAELDISEQVYFLGFVPWEDLIVFYRNAVALVYASFFGPENLPPLEAFALGCPVIASNVSGSQEQLGESALLVDPRDANEIALAIKLLYEDASLRQTLIQRGLERASKWTSEDFVKGIFLILDEFEPIRQCWSNNEIYRGI